MNRWIWAVLACSGALTAQAGAIHFDGDAGVRAGAGDFAAGGATWSGGRIETEGTPGLFGSGDFHYEVSRDGARVAFDRPVGDVRMFFVHGFGIPAGTARAFDANGAVLATAASQRATIHGAASNFVTLSATAPIAAIAFDGGAVDAVTWADATVDGLRYGTAVNGTWLNTSPAPYLAGQGVGLEYIPENRTMLLTWYTYAAGTSGAPRWLVGMGTATADGAELTLYATSGGRFNAAADVQQTAVGTARLQFTACDTARIDYALPGEQASGTFDVKTARALLAGYRCGP